MSILGVRKAVQYFLDVNLHVKILTRVTSVLNQIDVRIWTLTSL